MFYLINDRTGEWAHKDSIGEHDGKTTKDYLEAACFEDYSEASDYSQNFGPDWRVDE
ncbi:hypothetical protein [Sinorhizobium meliloti]|uniref:hypothetical protein n=1 Tax=Rhizobium meliloti TaxID=382 RepID=UPI0013E3E105|nr:hypothetical protein [Sinorhizobium meliloti]